MLSAAEANTLCSENDCAPGISWIVCVGPNTQLAELVGPIQQGLQVSLFIKIGLNRLNDACKDLACGAINGDVIALVNDKIGSDDPEKMLGLVNANTFTPCDTRQTKAACDHCCMASSAAARGENTLGNQHAMDVIGAGLWTYQYDRNTGLAQFLCAVGIK